MMRHLALSLTVAALCSAAAHAEPVRHADLIRSLDAEAYERGKAIYNGVCFACHGLDGKTPTNPQARSFAAAPMANGADPFAQWKTLTHGFNTMPAQTYLTPAQRYEVIHYIREAFLKKDNPTQYTPITDAYLKQLPVTDDAAGAALESGDRDYGPVLAAQLGGQVNHALHFRLPHAVTVAYDIHRMRTAGAWTGGFLDLSETHHYKQRGERMPKPDGEPLVGLDTWAWAFNGSFEIPDDAKWPRGPIRGDELVYRGHYLHGDNAVLSYAVHGRDVLETIGVDRSPQLMALHHTLRIGPGDEPLTLAVAQMDGRGADGFVLTPANAEANERPKTGAADGTIAVLTGERRERPAVESKPRHVIAGDEAKTLDLGTPGRTVVVRFRTDRGGTLIASAPAEGKWKPNGKTLFIRDGRLVFDIGWVGALAADSRVADGKWHTAALVVTEQATRLYVDGKREAERVGFRRDPEAGHVLKIGSTAPNFGGDYAGEIASVRIYGAALDDGQIAQLSKDGDGPDVKTLLAWEPDGNARPAPAPQIKRVFAAAAVVGETDGLTWTIDDKLRAVLTIPASDKPRVIRVIRSAGTGDEELRNLADYVTFSASNAPVVDPQTMTRGGPTRWPQELTVEGQLGEPVNGYALDTIPVPFDNPWNAWMRTSAVAFYPDGRAVVTTHGGDVYIVTGVDDTLSKVTWKRYCAGLFEPFGVLVVDGQIVVTCRDGLKRLHDYDGNGEADFVEAFYIDTDVSASFHAYNFDLHADSKGNLYFAKAGQYTQYDIPGAILRVPPEGGRADIVAWGIRTPNGMGALPGDRFTVSDNQGPWMPAGKISLIDPAADSFFGNMPNKRQEAWTLEHVGGKLPETYTEPIIWTPQDLDNSCGGQVWVDDARFGPLGDGRLLHSSFGKGWVYSMSLQEIDGVTQASMIPLPHQWDAGVMRLRVNPADGQVYGVGLSGWQGPSGGKDGCFQRLRYTGGESTPARIIESTRITTDGVELTFNFPLDRKAATDDSKYGADMWDYLWSQRYGSDQFSVRRPGEKGRDGLKITKATLSDDGRTLRLTLPELAVCDQLLLVVNTKAQDGEAFERRVWMTVHKMPE